MSETATGSGVTNLLTASAELRNELGRQRRRLTQIRDSHSLHVQLVARKIDALERQHSELNATLERCLDRYPEVRVGLRNASRTASPKPMDLVSEESMSWSVRPEVLRTMEHLIDRVGSNIRQSKDRHLGKGRLVDEAARKAVDYLAFLDAIASAVRLFRQGQFEADKTSADQRDACLREADALLGEASIAVELAWVDARPSQQPWIDPRWDGRTISDNPADSTLLAGFLAAQFDSSLGPDASLGCEYRTPYFVDLGDHLRIRYDDSNRPQALGLVESLLVRQLITAPPGEIKYHIFDPVGLGQSISTLLPLADYNADLIGGKVWSSTEDLREVLKALSVQLEVVIQKYLRSEYHDIRAFNAQAGELAEPMQYLVLLDFPTGFDTDLLADLKRLVENGKRCGINLVVGANASRVSTSAGQFAQVVEGLPTITFDAPFVANIGGYQLHMSLDPETIANADLGITNLVVEVGRHSKKRSERVISLDRLLDFDRSAENRGLPADSAAAAIVPRLDDPTTWWSQQSVRGISSPIGQRGARETSILTFDSENHSGALLVGRPGSGKSTLLHTFLMGITTQYSPDELELYLIDFKEGVEFQSYATEGLPHARCVAIESDREFGLSVLQSLAAEISYRGELLRSAEGYHSGLESFRRATGQPMTRLLLVFDEFQVLFTRNDKVGLVAAELLEQVIRQGRSFGIHVLLSSQSLAGLDALGSHVPQLLPVRILLPASEADGRRVLGEGNNAGNYLTSRGEGVVNRAGGAVERNERFQVAIVQEAERLGIVRALRAKADKAGFTRRPTVYDGRSFPPLSAFDPAQFAEELRSSGSSPLRIRVGVPMALHGTADLTLRREAGANVLLAARTEGASSIAGNAEGIPVSQLVALLASLAVSTAKVHLVDFTPIDEGTEETIGALADSPRIDLLRARRFPEVVSSLAALVKERIAADDIRAPSEILVLYGLHRARDLDSDVLYEPEGSLGNELGSVLRDGPEVGVHTWAWTDSYTGLTRRIGPAIIREFGWRVAGRMSAEESQVLIGSDIAATLRTTQIAIVQQDMDTEQRASSLGLPESDWLSALLALNRE